MLRFTYDYVKRGTRSLCNTTINDDLLNQLKMLKIKTKQPVSKMLDVMIIETLKDEKSTNEFIDKVRKY